MCTKVYAMYVCMHVYLVCIFVFEITNTIKKQKSMFSCNCGYVLTSIEMGPRPNQLNIQFSSVQPYSLVTHASVLAVNRQKCELKKNKTFCLQLYCRCIVVLNHDPTSKMLPTYVQFSVLQSALHASLTSLQSATVCSWVLNQANYTLPNEWIRPK